MTAQEVRMSFHRIKRMWMARACIGFWVFALTLFGSSAVWITPAPAGLVQAEQTSAIIGNGTIQLGVNEEGQLNVPGGTPSSVNETTVVGLRYLPTGNEAISHGCLCEGWGAADTVTEVSGSASEDSGVFGLTVVSFVADTSTATSVVEIGSTLRATHAFYPSPSPNLYQVDVSIQNTDYA